MQCFATLVLTLLLVVSSQPLLTEGHIGQHVGQKAVRVTGACSGIGRAIAGLLAEKGFYLYAGARKEKDLNALDPMEYMSSVRFDVARQEEVDAAVEFVCSQRRGLYGIVNNAGVYTGGPVR